MKNDENNEVPNENQDKLISTRRSFLKSSAAIGAGVLLPTLLTKGGDANSVFAKTNGERLTYGRLPVPTNGDIHVLRFLAAAEIIEDDLWQQYCELAVNNPGYKQALNQIDPSLVRYICDDARDERSHAHLINAYLMQIGQAPVSLEAFRTLPSSTATGANRGGRITNLNNLTVDTSWYFRYRGTGNPDFGHKYSQIVDIINHSTIPQGTTQSQMDLQLLAHSAAFHFAAIEQGGSSLYLSLIPKVTDLNVLAILSSIGPVEVYHFAVFHKSLESIFPISGNGLTFPDLKGNPNLAQAIFPAPTTFLSTSLPTTSVIRPRNTNTAGAVAAATGLVQSGLFSGQPQAFFDAVTALATNADAAVRAF